MDRLLSTIEDAEILPIGVVVNTIDFKSLNQQQRRSLGMNKEEPYYARAEEAQARTAQALIPSWRVSLQKPDR